MLFVDIANDLTTQGPQLLVSSDFDKGTRFVLEKGKNVAYLGNFEVKSCELFWGSKYIKFNIYDPSTEGNHQRIYWSVKFDGIYHSWDNVNWDKRSFWSI